ncbi:MAG: Ig-like domain-containing protein, partial [Candidatus Poribacteria bacterium]|nr:Ig-like domain-containing protein [Candidatus Poribacteria bacterium]
NGNAIASGQELAGITNSDTEYPHFNLTYKPNLDSNKFDLLANHSAGAIAHEHTILTGYDTFDFVAKDASLQSDPVTVNIIVNPVNDAPIPSPDELTFSLDEDTTYKFDVLKSVWSDWNMGYSDVDVDTNGAGDQLAELKIIDVPDKGVLKLNLVNVTVNQEIPLSQLSQMTYHPVANENNEFVGGSAVNLTEYTSFTVKIKDDGDYGAYNLNPYSNLVTIKLSVNPINDLPIFAFTAESAGSDATNGIIGFDQNDVMMVEVDEDFTGNKILSITSSAQTADEDLNQTTTYSLSPDPSTVDFATVVWNSSTEQVEISAITNKNGTQTFVLTATDDGAGEGLNVNTHSETFILTVKPVNDEPVFDFDPSHMDPGDPTEVTLNEDFANIHTVGILGSSLIVPNDENGQTVNYSLTPDPAAIGFANISIDSASGQVSINAIPNLHGQINLTVVATDDGPTALTIEDSTDDENSYSKTFTLIIEEVNDAPVVRQDVLEGQRASATISDGQYNGMSDSVLATIDSGQGQYVVPVTTTEDTDIQIQLSAADVDDLTTGTASNLVYSLAAGTTAHGSVSLNGDVVTYEPDDDYNGSDSFTFSVTDGELSESTVVSLTITEVNDEPEFSLSPDVTVDEDFSTTQSVTVVADSIPSDELTSSGGHGYVTYTLTPSTVDFATVTLDNSSGLVEISSIANKNGTQLFTLTAEDDGPDDGSNVN